VGSDYVKTIVGWLNTAVQDDPSGKRGERAARDTEPSIEVLAVFERGGEYFTLDGTVLPTRDLDNETARELARQSIRLPAELSTDKCIEELEKLCQAKFSHWLKSVWLAGELFLVFDERMIVS
jgi:hypothetical protein